MAKQTRKINGNMDTQVPFDVVEMFGNPGRFEIVNTETGEVIDNANGYGYKTKTNAYKAGWFKFGGGKKKVDDTIAWWHMPEHREFSEWLFETRSFLIDECRDMHMQLDGLRKHMAAKAEEYAKEHGIDDYKPEYFKSWDKSL